MWNRLVKKFFEFGGDRTWIESGLHSADKRFHLIALLSQVLAYNPETMVMDEKFFEKFDNLSKQYLAEAIHIISYYQSLACYAQAMGLVPEEPVDKNLLNIQGLLMPSRFSLENGKDYSYCECIDARTVRKLRKSEQDRKCCEVS